MSKLERQLFQKAMKRYGAIEPCQGLTFRECFQYQNGYLEFWFNDGHGNTHLLYFEESRGKIFT